MRGVEDLLVIEGERRKVVDREPGRVGGIGRGLDLVIGELDQRVVGDGHDPLARVSIERAVGVELLEKDLAQAGLLFELAQGRVLERLVDVDEAAGQRPLAQEGLEPAPDQQDLELVLVEVEAEHDAVDGQRRPGPLVGVGHGELDRAAAISSRSSVASLVSSRTGC